MATQPKENDTANFSGFFPLRRAASLYSTYEDSLLYGRFSAPFDEFDMQQRLQTVEAFTLLLCHKGWFTIEINQEQFRLSEGDMIFLPRNTGMVVRDLDRHSLELTVLALTSDYVKNLSFDAVLISRMTRGGGNGPVTHLDPEQVALAEHYFAILHANAIDRSADPIYRKSILRAATSSLMIQLMAFKDPERTTPTVTEENEPSVSRRSTYVLQFMKLVQENYRREHSLSYYAGQMYISPKYLSQIIKQATGYSAVEWIDHYVVVEAKNMLRFSELSIQQIAYKLNFSSQSSFGKFFKNLTGVSPSTFRRS